MTEPERDPGFAIGTPGGKQRESRPMIMLSEQRYQELLDTEHDHKTTQESLAHALNVIKLREKQMCEISEAALETIGRLLDVTNSRSPEWDANIAGIRETIKSILE